ncbi:MAG: glycoside hydrolase family 2 [Planctomycetes bacterium]|nr:glycoside hydrolase family 2 [Planctomycetota bacterium]MBL7044548.1 glycoside hydrolase family 2 [Pirellulaceae bacterium]
MHLNCDNRDTFSLSTGLCVVLGLLVLFAAWPSTALAQGPRSSTAISLDSDDWLLLPDPENSGREEEWWSGPRPDAKTTKVPWIIQDAFPGYHGVAWYWRDFHAPVNPHAEGRYLLRFWAVDYKADVWLNGISVGGHEGGETPFTLDVTEAIKPNAANRLAVRVLNPTNEPIDGIVLSQTAHRCKVIPYRAGAGFNHGGIVDSVELLLVPSVYVDDLFVRPDLDTGKIKVQVNVENAAGAAANGWIELTVTPASGGTTIYCVRHPRTFAPGNSHMEADLQVESPHAWDLNDPYLYRVTARVATEGTAQFDERSTRCGFRDFRFEDGYFRLNGRRIYLRSTHTCNHFPIGLQFPHDPDLARRDLLNLKVMGFNAVRFIWGGAARSQLDLCDEIGLLVYEESFAAWPIADSPKMAERFDSSVAELIRRDRNHPSVVIWGLLNEARDGPTFRHAVGMLPLIRKLDDTRMVMLNSGRWDRMRGGSAIGSVGGLDIWPRVAPVEPWVAKNRTDHVIQALGITWPAGWLALHPGPEGEYSVVRWTAPADGDIEISATFTGIAERATTDVHVLHNGQALFDGHINLHEYGNSSLFTKELAAREGDTIDCVVGFGNGSYGADSTALTVTIKSASGKTYDATADFSVERNPNGVWSYGQLAPGPKPNAATFFRYGAEEDPVKHAAANIGGVCNPGSTQWEDVVDDQHFYPRVPQTADVTDALRTLEAGPQPVFLSEYGIGSAVDLWRAVRHYERLGADRLEDAQFFQDKLNRFLADWQRWQLADTFDHPQDFFMASLRKMAGQRLLGLNAIRSNPNIVGHSLTGAIDHVMCGEGLATLFRELKPGTIDAMYDAWSPLRFCLFVEPLHIYRGSRVRLEAVLANEDALAAGEYPIRLQVVDPDMARVFERVVTVKIPGADENGEPPLATAFFSQDVTIDGPAGKYRFLATMEQGGAPTGGEALFHVADAAEMPAVDTEVVLWGEDPGLAKWLTDHGIRTRPFSPDSSGVRELILVSSKPAHGGQEAWQELVRRIGRGASVVFLSPGVFRRDDNPTGWLPLANKGSLNSIRGWLYLKDEWAKHHPIFDGLQAGGLMDYTFYREIIPDAVWSGQDPPAEAVAGAIKASQDYSSGLMVAVYELGAGRFILSTLRIRENLTTNPVAERLLRNLLRYAAHESNKPPAQLPADFDAQLEKLGY